jgi:hypothetical protein
MIRHRMNKPALVALAAAALLVPAAAAEAEGCRSSDLRYPFRAGGPDDFGVFKLRIAGGECATARDVARTWMRRFEREIDNGRVKLPRRVKGFRFRQLQPNEAQTYRLRGRRDTTTIRFSYRVPNG